MIVVMCFAALSFGIICAAGVFTVHSAVQLVPRFIGKTHSAGEIILYENMIVLGTIVAGILSVFWEYEGYFPQAATRGAAELLIAHGLLFLGGLFSGMFVGCLALSIAEMLDSIPIFLLRISWTRGLSIVIFSVAVGKIVGSLLYFGKGF